MAYPANNTVETTTTLANDMAAAYYEKRLVEIAVPNLVYQQFGQKRPIPQNGSKVINFRKYSPLSANTTALTEGVTPDGTNLTVTAITATVAQYGDFIRIADFVDMTAIDNNIVEATKLLGNQAGLSLDCLTRDIVCNGSYVLYSSKWNGTTETKVTAATDLDKTCRLTAKDIFTAVAHLEAKNAPRINGDYVGIVHPYAKFELMNDPGWIDAHKYAKPEEIYNGEIGKLGGVRFVETSNAKVIKNTTACAIDTDEAPAFATTATYSKDELCSKDSKVYKAKEAISAGSWDATKWTEMTDGTGRVAHFCTMILGDNAYGVTEIEGGGLQHIIKPMGFGDDPLNQRASCGWKATNANVRLVEEYMYRIESSSSLSASAKAN